MHRHEFKNFIMACAARPFKLRKHASSYTDLMKDFLSHMLAVNAKARWSGDKLISHPWVIKYQPFNFYIPNKFLKMLEEDKEKLPIYKTDDFELSSVEVDEPENVLGAAPKPETSFWTCLKSEFAFLIF